MDFPVQLENPHVVDDSQVWIGVVSALQPSCRPPTSTALQMDKGPANTLLNSSYSTRSDPRYLKDLGAIHIESPM